MTHGRQWAVYGVGGRKVHSEASHFFGRPMEEWPTLSKQWGVKPKVSFRRRRRVRKLNLLRELTVGTTDPREVFKPTTSIGRLRGRLFRFLVGKGI